MVRLQAIGNNRNISVSLPQKLIDKLKYQLRGKSMKRSVWIKDAIEMKFADVSTNEIFEMSLHQVMLHLIHREDFTDLEQVRVRDVYEKLFGDLPSIKSEQVSPPEPSMA
jgi:metal-responsive CopG/Arc/MetJ family transcriptional regulator